MSELAEKHQGKRIGILSPVAWRTPPRQYGAWETVASNITEGLVRNGWDVTLFATGDSVTKGKLHSVIPTGYEEDRELDPKVCEYLHISEFFEHANEFDLLHSHYDFMSLTYSRLVSTPLVVTIHGFSSPKIVPVYKKYSNAHYVSISDSDRHPDLEYEATVYNGVDLNLHEYFSHCGENLVFLGRIHPDKAPHLAIEVARRTRRKLVIAGLIQDEAYYKEKVAPWVDDTMVQYIGPVGPKERNALFHHAYALLHLNELPERFGLVMAEANASGVPVIAMDRGSCREVVADGETGFLVNSVDEAVDAVSKVLDIQRQECRSRVEEKFSLEAMTAGYERVYDRVLESAPR